jgi:hypothetical protein
VSGFEPGFHMNGRGGVLLQGWEEVTKLEHWVAAPTTLSTGGNGLRIAVGKHTPDPYLFEYCEPDAEMSLEITIGKVQVTRPARILSREPLVIEAWQEE